jgi:precorrin-3B C17-methyltransferase
MTGWLRVIGLGPGPAGQCSPEATAALHAASDLVGYGRYLARVPPRDGQRRHASDNGAELARARLALELASQGRRVAVVSSGDPGVFAMASAVCEAMEDGPPAWRALDMAVIPGISAMLAAAARLGAPLGHDFCVLSLSDNLKPWAVVRARLAAAAAAGFVMALYNPKSAARPGRLGEAFALLAGLLAPATPVAFATALGTQEERLRVTSLAAADPADADMRTLVLIGAPTTRLIERGAAPPLLYTPRFLAAAP